MNRILAAVSAAAIASAAPAGAAVLQVNGGGQLTGATGVTVGGSTYDVSFVDGTCSGLFGGCDNAAADFTFTTEADAQAAALALLGQVLIDGIDGQFDTNYELTLGCALNNASNCAVLIPFATNGVGATVAQALNSPAQDTNVINASPAVGFDTTGQPNYVYALFTASTAAAVPEPSAWAMMLLGFAGIGLALRRRRGTLTAAD